MTDITPEFYDRFVCAADRCGDTCCKGWDIVVDDETLGFYREHPDILRYIRTDDDGDTILAFENGVCPLLDKHRLCSVQLRFGGGRLCQTCRDFPRITLDYTEFREKMLTLACPEAARMMIIENEDFGYMRDDPIVRSDNGYDREYMNFLIYARKMTADIMRRGEPFFEKLRAALFFTENAQSLIDDEIFDIQRLTEAEVPHKTENAPDRGFVFDMHRDLDVMDREWLSYAVSCKNETIPDELAGELSRLVLYYIACYYLNAVATYDIITTMKRAYCAAVVCGALIVHERLLDDREGRALVYQKYSKEIEHSDENPDILTDIFLTEAFSYDNLI